MADEDDDYMNMTFEEETPAAPKTSLHRQQQKRKENALKAHVKSKAELEAEANAAREAALATQLDPTNRGAKMMAKLGFKGGALGKDPSARTQPIELNMKEDRGGIGMDNEKKRKIREVMEERLGEFRERNRQEREEKRNEGMVWGAMKVTERLDTEAEEERKADGKAEGERVGNEEESRESKKQDRQNGNTACKGDSAKSNKVNVLWRQLARQRAERERERRQRHEFTDSLSSRLPRLNDPDEDKDDKLAYGTEIEDPEPEEEDPELDAFWALEPAEKLKQIVEYLRTTYHYCFWCKYRYPDKDMEGCPGLTEEDHD
ncbi:hypothetical protein H2203_004774 [Taxawa tesnikishii (nom. ined.)]|nr:hypothetical protein H2203_004774 [Dothideales sp. JES 119]